MNRRYFGRMLAALGTIQGLAGTRDALAAKPGAKPAKPAPAPAQDSHTAPTADDYATFFGGDPLNVGIVVYPGMYLQDVAGLLAVFESLPGRKIHLLWKRIEVVGSGDADLPALIPVTPNTTFADCPKALDLLIVPGAPAGRFELMEDAEVLAFLQARAPDARYLVSVGSGSLVLGAAGLLQGYEATTSWPLREVLQDLGATPVKQRVVIDRNRITAAGITSSIDLGLRIVDKLRNPQQAQLVQLYLEYDPQPPYPGGSPEKAPPLSVNVMKQMYTDVVGMGHAAAQRAAAKLKG